MPEPTPYWRASYEGVDTTPRLLGSPSPPTITGLPASSGRRSTSTAAMNWSRSTWRTQCSIGCTPARPDPDDSLIVGRVRRGLRLPPRRRRQRLGGLDLVEPGEQQQVDDDRPQLRQHHL